MSNLIEVESRETSISNVTLNRPEKRNALSIHLLTELCEQLIRLSSIKSARVVIIRGAGNVFSSGLDLAEASDPSLAEQSARCVDRALTTLRDLRLVTIAAVHGGAYAGGAGLVAACDIAIGTHDLKIGFPEVRRGLLPALICRVLSPKIREGDLRQLLLTGEPISAARALEIGLLQNVCDVDKLQDSALGLARSIVAGGPQAIEATKRLLNQSYPLPESLSSTSMLEFHLHARRSAEAAEGLAAFLEKRKPRWC